MIWLSLHTIAFAGSKEAAINQAFDSSDSKAISEKAIKTIETDVRYAVDFPYLQTVAPNSIAWLYQPNTTINQPVMYSDDPQYYLRRRFNDRISPNGSIFMTGEKIQDFSAPVITLYGRNCLDFSLFGSLSHYREAAYYEENPTLYLITPDGEYQLDVFAGIRTKLQDKDTWKVPQDPATSLVTDVLPGILEKSFIKPKSSYLPIEGDAWAVLATESVEKQGTRYVIYARKRPIAYATAEVAYVNQLDMDSRASLNGRVSIKGVGDWMLYAQNDPLWDRLTFEIQTSQRRRTFGDGGCGPTAVAMAIVNMVEKEELIKLGAFASSPLGFQFCTCSVNEYWCSSKHLPYQLTTPDEYARYLPLAVASFACGNNIWGVQGRSKRFGTSMEYLKELCQIFDLSVTQTYKISEALTFLQKENTIAVACTTGYDSPFTKTSHFVVLAAVDDEYLYVLDPLRREDYQDFIRGDYLEVVAPGLVRIRLEDASKCNLRPIYQLQKNDKKRSIRPPV